MANANLTIRFRMAWWLKWVYLPGLLLFLRAARLVNPDVTIDLDKVHRTLKRGIRIEVLPARPVYRRF